MQIPRPSTASALATLAMLSGQAMAGTSPSGQTHMSVQIADSAGSQWNLNLSPFSSVDPSTGDVGLDLSSITAPISDSSGQWSKGTADIYDSSTGQYVSVDAITWHSWAMANGGIGSAASHADSPWSASVTFAALGNVDPEMSYGFIAKNNTNATQTYTVSYGESIDPVINGNYTLHADISGSVTNPVGTGNVSLSNATGFSKVQSVMLSGDGGLSFVNGGVDVGNPYTSSTVGSQPYGNDWADTTGTGSFNYWSFQTQFQLSAKDTAVLTGYAEITAVPEPASWIMPVIGLAAFGAMARRQRDSGQS